MSARPVSPQTAPPGPPTDADTCAYIAELCAELRYLARKPRLRTIDYLLDMVRLEAERTAKDLRAAATGDGGA
jgi:hypothetical protein